MGTPSASTARGSVRAKRGESARLISGRRDALAEASDERSAAFGVGEAVEGQAAQEVQQRADGVVLEDHGILAGREVHRLVAGDLGRRARGQRAGVERRDRRRRRPPPSPTRPLSWRAMTFM